MTDFVLPRPGAVSSSSIPPIPAPAEDIYANTFGNLLPPAQYIQTTNGKAAYYELLPASQPNDALVVPDRVLLIHGVQTPALGMLPLARALQASFQQTHFVLVDLWGHGLSETPIAPHEPSLFHQLIDDLLKHLQWPSVHLVGFSFGAVLTAGFTASRTSKVKSFTLIAPAGLIRSATFTEEQKAHLRGADEVAARRWILEFLEGGELVVPEDWKEKVAQGEVVAEAVKEWQMREHPGHLPSVVGIFRDGGVMDNDEVFSKAANSGVPATVVLGELDDLSTQKEFQQLGLADVHVVPQAGHGVPRTRAPEVAALIATFWKKLN